MKVRMPKAAWIRRVWLVAVGEKVEWTPLMPGDEVHMNEGDPIVYPTSEKQVLLAAWNGDSWRPLKTYKLKAPTVTDELVQRLDRDIVKYFEGILLHNR